MKKPLIVEFMQDQAMADALRQIDSEILAVSDVAHMTTVDFPRPPRLFVVHVLPKQAQTVRDTVQVLRRERPLTDVVLWAPQASGATVRMLFHAGAADVTVSHSPVRLVDAVRQTLAQQQILPRLNELATQRTRTSRFDSMLSRSDAMWDLFELCMRIAQASATVLISGETGTGKELLARAIHRRSGRAGRFVAANCASIPSELVTSELFGHEKGAFTGADRAKKGLVAHANEGTLFLDEIGDMPSEAQQSLLRMLQERRIRPVGGLSEKQVNVRVIAATNVALDAAVRDGAFREDLYYRLDVIRMDIPPLRDRPEDILFLFGHFTRQLSKHYGLQPPTFSDSFLDALLEYSWPGNVRQLENFSERLVLARPKRALNNRDFAKLRSTSRSECPETPPEREPGTRHRVDTTRTLQENLAPLVEQIEREYLRSVLTDHAGRVEESARCAGISRRTLLRKMNLYELDKDQFK